MKKIDRYISVNIVNSIVSFMMFVVGLVAAPNVFSQETIFDDAQNAYADQNWPMVIELLETAPATVERGSLLGLAYYYEQQLELAIPHLKQAQLAASDNIELNHALLDSLLIQGQLADAKSLLEQLNKQDPTYYRYHARIAVAEQDAVAVDRWYQTLLIAEDDRLAQESAAEYIAYLQQHKRHSEAYTVAQQALARDPDSFLSYRFLQVSDVQRAPAINPWRFNLGYRVEYDDNVSLLPDDLAPSGDQGQADFRHVITADAVYQKRLANQWTLFAEARGTQSLHQQITDFDFTSLNGLLGAGQAFEGWGWRLPVEVLHNRFGGDSFSTTVTASPGINVKIADNFYSHVYGRYASSDFDLVAFSEDDRSADVVGGGMLLGGNLKQGWTLRAIVEYLDYAADGSNWDRGEFQVFTYSDYRLTSEWAIGGGVRFTDINFENINVPFSIERDDQSFEYYLSSHYQVAAGWFVRAQVTFVDNQSNIEVFDYQRLVTSLGLSWQF